MQWFEDADAQVVAVCDAAVERLEGMGAKVVDICIPELEACRVAHTCLIGSELGAFANGLADANPGLGARYSLDLRPALRTARGFTAADVIQAQKIRRRMTILFDRAFADVDVIVSPTTAITAPAVPGSPLGQSNLKQVRAGQPAIRPPGPKWGPADVRYESIFRVHPSVGYMMTRRGGAGCRTCARALPCSDPRTLRVRVCILQL